MTNGAKCLQTVRDDSPFKYNTPPVIPPVDFEVSSISSAVAFSVECAFSIHIGCIRVDVEMKMFSRFYMLTVS